LIKKKLKEHCLNTYQALEKNSLKFPEISQVETIVREGGDIEISWRFQDWNLKHWENPKVHLRSFVVEIGNVVLNVDGKCSCVFTKEEQIASSFDGNMSTKVRQV
jgi:hypothetical protein